MRSKETIIKKVLAAVIVAGICAVIIYLVNGARSFWEGFGYTYLLWTIVDAYHDYWFHIKGSFTGMLLGLPIALVVGAIVALIA